MKDLDFWLLKMIKELREVDRVSRHINFWKLVQEFDVLSCAHLAVTLLAIGCLCKSSFIEDPTIFSFDITLLQLSLQGFNFE